MNPLKKNFEFKAILLLSLIFAIVLLLSYGAYSKLTKIVSEFAEVSSPDARLAINNDLKIKLTEIGSIAKTHSLTNDKFYIESYVQKEKIIQEDLADLWLLNEQSKNKINVVYLDSLIQDKLIVLDGIMYSQDPFRVQAALEKVLLNIKKSEGESKNGEKRIVTTEDIETSKINMQKWLVYGSRSELLEKLRKEREIEGKKRYNSLQQEFSKKIVSLSKENTVKKSKKQQRIELRLWKRALSDSIKSILKNYSFDENQIQDLNKIMEERGMGANNSDDDSDLVDEDDPEERQIGGIEDVISTKSALDFNFINKEINAVRKEEFDIEQQIKFAELQMITLDNELSVEIEKFFERFIEQQKTNLSATAKIAGKDSKSANRYIAFISFAIGMLVIGLMFLIVSYVRKNNAYKIALKQSQNDAENASKSREKFFANMSHEIRTPMNAIVGFSDQLSESDLDENQRNYVSMIQKSSEHLVYLINDVLDFSKLQSGKLKLERMAFEIASIANEVTSFSQQLAIEKNIQVRCVIDESVPKVVIGDSFRLRQILLNLMSNSVKFTEKGSVQLFLSFEQKNKEEILLIKVADTGSGMDEETLGVIFNEFEQGNADTARNYGGTGLGLSISKMLVELMNGKIQLTSKVNEGTTASIQIPIKVGKESDVSAKTSLRIVSKLKRVLIVDDEKFNRQLLSSIFLKNGIEFEEAIDGVDALAKMQTSNFDIVLMDARMPRMNGIEATLEIRSMQDVVKRETKIIVLTAAVSEEEEQEFRNAGMDGYVSKPFKEHELFREINRILESKVAPKNAKTKRIQLSKNTQSFDFTHLKKMSGNDKQFYTEMLKTFISSTKNGMATIKVGFQNEDWELVANEAHKISAPCKHLGAYKLYNLLSRIENVTRTRKSTKHIKTAVKDLEEEADLVLNAVSDELSLKN